MPLRAHYEPLPPRRVGLGPPIPSFETRVTQKWLGKPPPMRSTPRDREPTCPAHDRTGIGERACRGGICRRRRAVPVAEGLGLCEQTPRPLLTENSHQSAPSRMEGAPDLLQRCLTDVAEDDAAARATEDVAIGVDVNRLWRRENRPRNCGFRISDCGLGFDRAPTQATPPGALPHGR